VRQCVDAPRLCLHHVASQVQRPRKLASLPCDVAFADCVFQPKDGWPSPIRYINWEGALIQSAPSQVKSAVFELWLTLLDKGGHAFLLIFRRKERMEEAALEAHPFSKSGLKGPIYSLFCG
jgi:hypothetical protein